MRKTVAALLVALLATVSTACVVPPAPGPAVPVPIVFVHGYISDAYSWHAFVDTYRAEGTPANQLWAWQYDTVNQSNEVTAEQLGHYVDDVLAATGATKVDLVSHSMGSLNARWCVKFGSCEGKVRRFVSLAGANHGTAVATACYTLWQVITCAEMSPGSPFLATLNAAPELPAGPTWYTLWSANDGVIVPASSTPFDGATNFTIDPSLDHLELLVDPGVITQVKNLLA